MRMWRTSVVTASDRIFPGLTYHDRKKEFYDIGMDFINYQSLVIDIDGRRKNTYLRRPN